MNYFETKRGFDFTTHLSSIIITLVIPSLLGARSSILFILTAELLERYRFPLHFTNTGNTNCFMKRSEAKKIFQQGEEVTISKLLELSRELKKLQKGKLWRARNSINSSKPPSTDSEKDRKTRPKKKKSNRKPGDQPGHPGARRPLLPESEVQNIVKIFPKECERCSKPLPQEFGRQTAGPPARHQVFEIEPVKPFMRNTSATIHIVTVATATKEGFLLKCKPQCLALG